jgi:hypothetical protein
LPDSTAIHIIIVKMADIWDIFSGYIKMKGLKHGHGHRYQRKEKACGIIGAPGGKGMVYQISP